MNLAYIITVLLVIFMSMTLHEFMHGFVAYKLGDETPRLLGRLSLNPLKHIDPVLTIGIPLVLLVLGAVTGTSPPIFGGAKPVPFNPNNVRYGEWGVALLAIAGPLTNLILAFVCYGILAVTNVAVQGAFGEVLLIAVQVNLGFFAFNILPIPPLDGSRVLYSIAPDLVRRVMEMMEQYGLVIVMLIVFLGNNLIMDYLEAVINGTVGVFSRIFGV